MANARRNSGLDLRGLSVRARLLYASAACLIALCSAFAESAPPPDNPSKIRELSGRFPDKPSMAPAWSFPVEPLGFTAPGANYVGMRNTMVSLDFLGENRLLFTFRVPGLMLREPGSTSDDQRQIRAVVLTIPTGAVQSETNWTVHDRLRYLWALDDEHFLLRDGNTLFEVDAALNRKPLLQFPGALVSIGLNPGRQYIVTNSREPVKNAGKDAGASANATKSDPDDDQGDDPDLVLRIMRLEASQVMLATRVRSPVILPINDDGYLGVLRGNGVEWTVDLNYFTGQNRALGKVKSACAPVVDFLSENETLVTACSNSGDDALVAMNLAGATLWTDLSSDRQIWPQIAEARSGLRFARETLYVSRSVNGFNPLGSDDIKGQWVQIFDAATGAVAFESPANPILDGGGNVAISPSGRRVAVLNAGALQVFELPAPPALPSTKN